MNDVARAMIGVATLPVTVAARGLHDWTTGPVAVLDLEISRGEDILARQQLVHLLRHAARSPRVQALLLRLREPPGSWAACQDLRAAIAKLQDAGKAVYAWVEAPGNALMWIASQCDRVFLAPTGEVSLLGVGVELTFFGQALERLGVQPDFEAAGTYKSFGEAWTRSFASPANQEAVTALVSDLHAQLLEDVSEGRGLELDQLGTIIEEAPLGPQEALSAGLVDELCYPDELLDWLKETHGPKTRLVRWQGWANRESLVRWLSAIGETGKSVTVVHLEGPIVMDGMKSAGQIRAREVVPILRAIRKNPLIGAVVLHINSPGGSALASDLMWREVELLREEKPVVAVFEDVSASGGFYLSAPANEIVVRPGTLTGSIGVFGGKLVVGEGLRRLGVTTQEVTSSENANMLSASRRFSDAQRVRFRRSLQRFYDGFVSRVAKGRDREPEEIEPYCRGRVWTGRAARERGLVDHFGDLYDGIERARVLAQLPHGGYVRHDLITWRRRNWVQKMVSSAIRGAVGPGVTALTLVRKVLGSRVDVLLDVLVRHEGEAIAMLPFHVEPR